MAGEPVSGHRLGQIAVREPPGRLAVHRPFHWRSMTPGSVVARRVAVQQVTEASRCRLAGVQRPVSLVPLWVRRPAPARLRHGRGGSLRLQVREVGADRGAHGRTEVTGCSAARRSGQAAEHVGVDLHPQVAARGAIDHQLTASTPASSRISSTARPPNAPRTPAPPGTSAPAYVQLRPPHAPGPQGRGAGYGSPARCQRPTSRRPRGPMARPRRRGPASGTPGASWRENHSATAAARSGRPAARPCPRRAPRAPDRAGAGRAPDAGTAEVGRGGPDRHATARPKTSAASAAAYPSAPE